MTANKSLFQCTVHIYLNECIKYAIPVFLVCSDAIFALKFDPILTLCWWCPRFVRAPVSGGSSILLYGFFLVFHIPPQFLPLPLVFTEVGTLVTVVIKDRGQGCCGSIGLEWPWPPRNHVRLHPFWFGDCCSDWARSSVHGLFIDAFWPEIKPVIILTIKS